MRVLCPKLSQIQTISHGFFTREGGVSESAAFHSLNCGYGSGDLAKNVEQNRAFVARALDATALLTPYQTHSAKVVIVDKPWPDQSPPEADAIVTNIPGIAIGVLTADCVPILLADEKNRIIGAIHAGWKGAIGGVIEAGVEAMQKLGAKHITAAIGPAIEQYSYEVGSEFYDQFLKASPGNAQYFEPSSRDGHHLFDLKGYVRERLKKAGISCINMLANDTCLEENRFFSYRRSCQRSESAYGRQVSALVINSSPRRGEAGRGAFLRYFKRFRKSAPTLTLPLWGREFRSNK
jgi:YfiH family protein